MPILALLAFIAGPAWAGTLTRESIKHGGLTRTYEVYVPSGSTRGLPVIFGLHGGGVAGGQFRRYTQRRLERLADRRGFLVVYPDSFDGHWNAGYSNGRRAEREGVDDVAFLGATADRMVLERGADPKRLYAVGISDGAFMIHRLACEDSPRWAAVAALAGAIGVEAAAACRPARPVPILLVNGTGDPFVHWEERYVRLIAEKIGTRLTVPETVARWVGMNACPKTPRRSDLRDTDPDDGTRWSLTAWGPCKAGSEVLLYKVEGGGHTWPNGKKVSANVIGRTSRDVNFEPLLWSFFARHAQ